MKIIFDADVLLREPGLKGTPWRIFWHYVQTWRCDAMVPAVTLEEVVNKLQERVCARLSEAAKRLQELRRTLAGLSTFTYSLPDPGKLAADVDAQYKQLLKDKNVLILPWPEISHQEVVARCLRRHRPFQQDDRGYRDALMWETVLAEALKDDRLVVFITNNVTDFADETRSALHPDLLTDIGTRGLPSGRVEVCFGLEAFNEKHVIPKLKLLEDWKVRIREASEDFETRLMALEEELRSAVEEKLDYLLDRVGVRSVQVVEMLEPEFLEIVDVRELNKGTLLIRAKLVVPVGCEVVISEASASDLDLEKRGIMVVGEAGRGLVLAEANLRVEIEASVIFDTGQEAITSLAVDSIERSYFVPQSYPKKARGRRRAEERHT